MINTNVVVPSDEFSANVTGTDFRFYNNKNTFVLYGSGALSSIKDLDNEIEKENGFKYSISGGKIGGKIRYSFSQSLQSDKYNQNHMGYSQRNNYINNQANFSYVIEKPFWNLLSFRTSLSYGYSTLYKPNKYTSSQLYGNINATFKNNWSIGLSGMITPKETHDYFEARETDKLFIIPKSFEIGGHLITNNNKRFTFRNMLFFDFYEDNRSYFIYSFDPTLIINDRFSLDYNFQFSVNKNEKGYVMHEADNSEIIFGRRDRKAITNRISFNYIFTNKASLSFRLRHYYSSADYKQFYNLQPNGLLAPSNYSSQEHNINFNTFNIDMVYTWNFAPGSELSLVWKNMISDYSDLVVNNYFENFGNIFDSSQTNSFSLKILYYLDWHYLKKLSHDTKNY